MNGDIKDLNCCMLSFGRPSALSTTGFVFQGEKKKKYDIAGDMFNA